MGGCHRRDRLEVRFQTEVIQELCCQGPCWLHVPSLVKDRVVARLDDPRVKVEVQDILVRCRVPKEDASEVMSVELASTNPRPFNTNPSAKQPEVRDVWLTATPRLVGHFVYGGVH